MKKELSISVVSLFQHFLNKSSSLSKNYIEPMFLLAASYLEILHIFLINPENYFIQIGEWQELVAFYLYNYKPLLPFKLSKASIETDAK